MFELFSFTDDRKDLFAALIKAQAAMGCAVKDSKNPHFRSSYASLSAVIDAVIPVLNEHGVGVLQMPHLDETQVQLTTVLLHSSGQMVASTVAKFNYCSARFHRAFAKCFLVSLSSYGSNLVRGAGPGKWS